MKSQKIKNKFIELRAEGYSYNYISKELKTSKQTLLSWGKEFDNEIKEAEAINRDELVEIYRLNKEARVQQLASINDKILEELNKRDFANIQTEKLLNLNFKYHQTINDILSLPLTAEQNAETYKLPEIKLVFQNDESAKRNALDYDDICS